LTRIKVYDDEAKKLRISTSARPALMFRHRQQRRRWAAMALLLWLFGVGTGLAHACLVPKLATTGILLSTPQANAVGAHHHATMSVHAHHGEPAQAGQDVGTPDQQGSPNRTN
jgi:hypothetical protein